MKNKTCGECRWFSDNRCNLHNNQYIFGDRPACKDFKQQPTVFDRITSSPEALAPKFVYNRFYMEHKGDLSYWVSSYFSTIIPVKSWEYESDALAATVEKLKEVEK